MLDPLVDRTAPPPPNMRLIAKENQVDILWDNRSETTQDLRLNVVDFESYRIWRADNWTRPFGTDVNTGPGGDLWALLAEFDLPSNSIGSDTGLQQIRYQPGSRTPRCSTTASGSAPIRSCSRPICRGSTSPSSTRRRRWRAACGTTATPIRRCCAAAAPAARARRAASVRRWRPTRDRSTCAATAPAFARRRRRRQHAGAHYFYAVTATDHKLEVGPSGALEATGPGLSGDPSSNFVYMNPPTNALAPANYGDAESEIYVIPNPATPESMKPWKLEPNNNDPTGTKVEFHHLPQTTGRLTIFTLGGDMVKELTFDGTTGNGTISWDLVSRNGQDVTSGVYLFSVEADDTNFKRFVGKFVVIR
jgi:hypothetical protein